MVSYAYMCCVCVFSLRRESPDMILGDKPLIYEVVLSHPWEAVPEVQERPPSTQKMSKAAPPGWQCWRSQSTHHPRNKRRRWAPFLMRQMLKWLYETSTDISLEQFGVVLS
jgi:hypothetical protein